MLKVLIYARSAGASLFHAYLILSRVVSVRSIKPGRARRVKKWKRIYLSWNHVPIAKGIKEKQGRSNKGGFKISLGRRLRGIYGLKCIRFELDPLGTKKFI